MNRLEEITKNLHSVQARIASAAARSERDPADITLIAVTKNFPLSDAQILYDLGVRDFGENRDQEGSLKSKQLPGDLRWHFQGQIQGRKIKSIANWANSLHSLDLLEHARKFEALGESKVEDFFIQVNFDPERHDRGGVAIGELGSFLSELQSETSLIPIGLMTVAPLGAPSTDIFAELKREQLALIATYPRLQSLSMGMSNDFEDAIHQGATHLRIGSSILGSRGLPA